MPNPPPEVTHDMTGDTRPRPLRVCGTAAAEGFPGIHCGCDTCAEAWLRGGKDLRSRAAYDLGDDVRIDFGPDSYLHARAAGRGFSRLRHLLVTHSHEDHWYPLELAYRDPGFCIVPEGPPLVVYGNERVVASARTILGDGTKLNVEFRTIAPFETFTLGDDIRVTTLRASHAPDEDALNLIIEERGRSVLIGHDTGWWDDETWDFIAGRHVHVALVDCTYGRYDTDRHHLGAPAVIRFVGRLQELGCLDPSSRPIATHISHNGHALHSDLKALLGPHGIEVAWDGMVIE
jgi:phosphoribosyl 1,2-cyclic phosphate phosphodiesterase